MIPGIPQDGRRDLPDISLAAAAHDYYEFCIERSCQNTSSPDLSGGTGTSVAAPSFAGIMAIVDQKLAGRQGLANYALYELAAAEDFSSCNSSSRTDPTVPPGVQCPFNDITVGNNSVPGRPGFNAGPGYDLASGLGSVNASVLVNAWSALGDRRPSHMTLSVNNGSSINIAHGQSITLAVTVTPQSGTGTPTGAVGLGTSNGAFVFATGALTNGSTGGTITNLPGGAYDFFATYAGDGVFAPTVSKPIPTTVSPENSTVTLGIAPVAQFPPSPYFAPPLPTSAFLSVGSPAVVYVQVSGVSGPETSPSGVVNIFVNGQPVSAPLNSNGQAELHWCFVTASNCQGAGQYQFTASYSGDNSFNPSVSAIPVTLIVTRVTPILTWHPASIEAGTPLPPRS